MRTFYLVSAAIAGAMLPLQAGINAQLKTWLGNSIYAALASLVVGALSIFVCALAFGGVAPSASVVPSVPWWAWTGGALGAIFVLAATILAPKLGATVLIGCVVGGQMGCSLVLDHFALAGFASHPLNLGRAAGAFLLIAGVALIQRF
jgi:transporter family-2 protein